MHVELKLMIIFKYLKDFQSRKLENLHIMSTVFFRALIRCKYDVYPDYSLNVFLHI